MKNTATTTATKKATAELQVIGRAEFKKSGYILWGIQSGEKVYQVSCNLKHQVTGCEQKSGEPCLGWKYNRKCKHTTLVQAREYEREPQEREAFCTDFRIYE